MDPAGCDTQQVKALSSEVGQLRVLKATLEEHTVEDRLQELSRRVEDRQTRAETAIYQVIAACS